MAEMHHYFNLPVEYAFALARVDAAHRAVAILRGCISDRTQLSWRRRIAQRSTLLQGFASRALNLKPRKAAADRLSDRRGWLGRSAVTPHPFVPALAGEVVGLADQLLALTPQLFGLLRENGSCKQRRYAPPVHMIKLTMEREITPYVWVRPEDDDRR
jgi:hypothetical protein